MNTPTYKEQFDKITEAYIKGEIKAVDSKFCFCGTLCDNSSKWFGTALEKHHRFKGYKGSDFVRMETALFTGICNPDDWFFKAEEGTMAYEENLFSGMVAALEVLKQIHIERGEVIDDVPVFIKRQLV